VFTRQFATMINAGLPLVQCLDILSQQTENSAFKAIIASVMSDVESGSTLAEALRKHPKVFDKLFTNMVQAGEAGGVLDDILLRLASYIEKAEALRRKVKSAMTYPLVVASVAIGATVFMLIFIIPTFAKIFLEFGGELPLPTKIVMGLSTFLRNTWFMLIGAAIVMVVLYRRYVATEKGRRTVDQTMLNIPILGDVLRKGAIARFTRTLGTLISSGYQKALDIIAERYHPTLWNIYAFHCSDGDNFDTDNANALRAAKDLTDVCNLFGYGEIKPMGARAYESSMLNIFRRLEADNFHTVLIERKEDIWTSFKAFLAKDRAAES